MMIFQLIVSDHMSADAGFIIPPKITVEAITPKMHRLSFDRRRTPLRYKTPASQPIDPIANICHGVHGPWENSIFETSMVIAPTKNPVSPPKATPARIVIATTGLNSGSMKNAARPATFSATSTAISTSSRACGLRPSKMRKNGSIHSSRMSSEMK